MKLVAPTLGLALAATAACAPTTPYEDVSTATADARQCFTVQSVNGFAAVDRDTLNVRSGVNDVYQLQLFGPCQDLNWNEAVGLRTRGANSFVCDSFDVDVVSPTITGPEVCHVTALRKLTPTEVAQLPAGQRP